MVRAPLVRGFFVRAPLVRGPLVRAPLVRGTFRQRYPLVRGIFGQRYPLVRGVLVRGTPSSECHFGQRYTFVRGLFQANENMKLHHVSATRGGVVLAWRMVGNNLQASTPPLVADTWWRSVVML